MTSPRRLRPDEARLWALVASTVPGARLPDESAYAEVAEPLELETPPRPPPHQPAPRPRASAEALVMLRQAGVSASATWRQAASGRNQSTWNPAPSPALRATPSKGGGDHRLLSPPPMGEMDAKRTERARPDPIEPNRKRRIVRAREPIGGRLDLHGHDHDRARAALHAFIARAHDDGARAVLVITGKGRSGEGLLRRLTPQWLAEPPSRGRVAGLSVAEARHGGEGALYVALKRRE